MNQSIFASHPSFDVAIPPEAVGLGTGAIIGIALGAVIVIAAVVLIILSVRKRKAAGTEQPPVDTPK